MKKSFQNKYHKLLIKGIKNQPQKEYGKMENKKDEEGNALPAA